MTRQRNYYYPDLVGSDILKQIGIQGVTTTGIHNVPALNITGITTTDQPNPQALTLDTNFEGTDNVSWTRGRHSMKVGFDAIRDQLGGYNYPNSMYGSYNFNGAYTGFGYADFLLGIPQTTQLTIPNPPRYLRGTTWSAYAQDQFKVNQRLTLNYGVRYELLGPSIRRPGLRSTGGRHRTRESLLSEKHSDSFGIPGRLSGRRPGGLSQAQFLSSGGRGLQAVRRR